MNYTLLFRRLASVLGLVLIAASTAVAQSVDIIRGRVLGPDTVGVANVLVTATTLSGNVSRTARTDRNGRYTISFPGGEGNYWVTFTALGFTPRRYQVLRTADQEILIADARLSAATVTLDQITVSERAAVSRNDTLSDVSGTERAVTADPGFLGADQLGDLAAMAASIPGVQLLLGADGAADAFSVFGLGGDQNNTQLNGLNFGDASVPRDAQVSTSLSTSPYDVSRGGFSGGQLQVRTRSGSNFRNRSLSSNVIAPPMQWVDRVGAATSQQYTNLSLGGSASGPIKQDQSFFNTSFQLDRRMQDLQTLLNSDELGFQSYGVAGDSVSRLINILNTQNAPFDLSEYSSQTINTRGSLLGSFDLVPQNSTRGNTYTATISGNINRTSPVGGGNGGFGGQNALFTPSRDGSRQNYGGSTQLRHSGQAGFFGLFTETTLGFNFTRNTAEPFVNLPAGSVRVNSSLSDGSASVRNLAFAGSTNLNTASQNTTLAGNNTLSWFSSDNRHRVKFTSELRKESYWQDFTQNQLGTFSFNSLADLEANVPASFTRQLSPRRRNGSQIVGAFSLGDAWRPTNDVQVQYGVRLDGNKYLQGPNSNPDIATAFDRDNAEVPNRLYFSPRLGFSWTYGQADQLTLVPGMVRAPRAVIRGGFGVFQNTPGLTLVQGAIDNTGLPSGLQSLTCLGTAAPIPDWTSYAANVSSIPNTCADGSNGTVFSNSSPNVTFFSGGYLAQRSLRSNLQWSGAILKNRFTATVDATWSRNQNQGGGIDINFPGIQQFALGNEAGRPIYVPTSSIVTTTGAIAWRGS
ncbi:MAG: carboxypeptidase regulatory-like domain-containing protein, partial [Gemmatimonadaceae bacterium]|nr:carboxypeptidase regulatory-like domain-containing protein [Gemmatimonadaceae bacterium]